MDRQLRATVLNNIPRGKTLTGRYFIHQNEVELGRAGVTTLLDSGASDPMEIIKLSNEMRDKMSGSARQISSAPTHRTAFNHVSNIKDVRVATVNLHRTHSLLFYMLNMSRIENQTISDHEFLTYFLLMVDTYYGNLEAMIEQVLKDEARRMVITEQITTETEAITYVANASKKEVERVFNFFWGHAHDDGGVMAIATLYIQSVLKNATEYFDQWVDTRLKALTGVSGVRDGTLNDIRSGVMISPGNWVVLNRKLSNNSSFLKAIYQIFSTTTGTDVGGKLMAYQRNQFKFLGISHIDIILRACEHYPNLFLVKGMASFARGLHSILKKMNGRDPNEQPYIKFTLTSEEFDQFRSGNLIHLYYIAWQLMKAMDPTIQNIKFPSTRVDTTVLDRIVTDIKNVHTHSDVFRL